MNNRILNVPDIMNPESICIFSDASYRTEYNNINGISCPSICTVHNDKIINQEFAIEYGCNSQRGELYALLMAIIEAVRFPGYHIKIFSDNLNGVLALRERLFRWINLARRDDSDDLDKKNIDVIMNAVYTIIENSIQIEFFHVKGHVNISIDNSVAHAKRVFAKSNHIRIGIDSELIKSLSYYNNMVDAYSTYNLNRFIEKYYYKSRLQDAITFDYDKNYNYSNYRELLILPENRYNKYKK